MAEDDAEIKDSEEEDEPDCDFDAVAEQAVGALGSWAQPTGTSELKLDVGIGPELLYLRGKGSKSAFNTAVLPGQSTIDYEDFSAGCEADVPASTLLAREVRGAPVRPSDDTKLRKKEAKARREERLEGWFGLPKQKMTPELVNELRAIQLRGSFDPKRFYKANDSKKLPTHFVMATEVGGGMAPAGEQATHTKRKGQSFLDSILKDQRAQEWMERKTGEVIARNAAAKFSGHGQPKPEGIKSTRKSKAWKKQRAR